MANRKRTTIPYQVRQIARKMNVSITVALAEYNSIQQARAISSEESMQGYALGVSSNINQWKLNNK